MRIVNLKSYAKINLAIDILGTMPNGYHEVRMVMQQLELHDDVCIRWTPDDSGEVTAEVHTNRYFIPTDERNTAYKAALIMAEKFPENGSGKKRSGRIRVDIKKKVPVAAGMAGGSGNGAAVIHGLNRLWKLGLDVETMCDIAAPLGADMPFSVMGQAKSNKKLGLAGDPRACTCALAEGTGTDLTPLPPLRSIVVISKPPISVSTKDVYAGIDDAVIEERPDIDAVIDGLKTGNIKKTEQNMANVLESYTLKRYNFVSQTKEKMIGLAGSGRVMMTGSGPTVFCLTGSQEKAEKICRVMKKKNKETFLTAAAL